MAVPRTLAHLVLWSWSVICCATLSFLALQAFGIHGKPVGSFFMLVLPVLLSIPVARLLAVSRKETAFAAVGALAGSVAICVALGRAFVMTDHS